jgi:soluble lytic murein transglycosylase
VHLSRAEEALASGALAVARVELKELKPRENLSAGLLLWIAKLSSEAGAHSVAFQFLTELIQRSEPAMRTEAATKLIFPLNEWPRIREAAEAARVDPLLALSLVKQESAFDSEAVSSSGALGFSQLMPFTALDLRPGLSRAEILDSSQNLAIGFSYLRKLLDRWKGNEVLALASYNAGPGAVERWLKSTGLTPSLDPEAKPLSPREQVLEMAGFIDRIPYKETRDYVGSILRNVLWYRTLLEPKPQKAPWLVQSFWRKASVQSLKQ